ncbi:PREDICTED: uncharacterized protein LOC106804891 [Priapulus caudatus]|uniref:Uncharacterized protein LOC106804891 n=1 Tax=Priapulus caudatus TaxID=37621 RepID=A0ABM1DP95_PRICU|nr:PREDICTED: uncharacterized protein LOC106804891 [Priapulus caudatus]
MSSTTASSNSPPSMRASSAGSNSSIRRRSVTFEDEVSVIHRDDPSPPPPPPMMASSADANMLDGTSSVAGRYKQQDAPPETQRYSLLAEIETGIKLKPGPKPFKKNAKKVITVLTGAPTVVTEHNIRPSSMQQIMRPASHAESPESVLTADDELPVRMNASVEGDIVRADSLPVTSSKPKQENASISDSVSSESSEEHLLKPSLVKNKISESNMKPSELLKNQLNRSKTEQAKADENKPWPCSPSKSAMPEPVSSHTSQHSAPDDGASASPSKSKLVYVEHLIRPSEIREQKHDVGENKENARQGASLVSKAHDHSIKPVIIDGEPIPPWKKELLVRKVHQEDEIKKSEEAKWAGIPEWKRQLMEQRERHKEGPSEELEDDEEQMPPWKKELLMKKKHLEPKT